MVVHYVMFLLYVGYQREVRWGVWQDVESFWE